MGAGQSDLYKGTYGDDEKNIPEELKNKIVLPKDESQIKHIFRNAEGHIKDTLENREMLCSVANDKSCHIGKDSRGNDWHMKINEDGTQTWVVSRNGTIRNGGINNPPHLWNDNTGLSRNIFKGD